MFWFLFFPIFLYAFETDHEKIDVVCTQPPLEIVNPDGLFISEELTPQKNECDYTLKDAHTFFITVNMDNFSPNK